MLSLTNQVFGRSLQRGKALLKEIHTIIGPSLDAPIQLLTRLRRNQHANSDADADAKQKAPEHVLVHFLCSFSKASASNCNSTPTSPKRSRSTCWPGSLPTGRPH